MPRMIRAGKYNKAISLQKQVNETNDYGGFVSKWKTVANIRAAVERYRVESSLLAQA